jgi:hypothetical protein
MQQRHRPFATVGTGEDYRLTGMAPGVQPAMQNRFIGPGRVGFQSMAMHQTSTK